MAKSKRLDRRAREDAIRKLIPKLNTTKPRTLLQRYAHDATQFAKTQPAFYEAYSFLMRTRAEELTHYFFGNRRIGPFRLQKIKSTIEMEEMALVKAAFAKKTSPAERTYLLALSRGFRPQTAKRRRRKNR